MSLRPCTLIWFNLCVISEFKSPRR